MALINDTDANGKQVVTLTKIVSDAFYVHPSFPMTVWPPIYPDGSKPYGEPLVHLFYIDRNRHAKWMRMDPAVSQTQWTVVQDFGFMTGIMVYRGIVTMWNEVFARSYNFFGGSELVFSDGSNGPTTSGANPAGNNLMSNQPFHKGAENFWASYDAPAGTNYFGQPFAIHEAFGCYLFNYYRQTANFEDSAILTPPGPHEPANPAGRTGVSPVLGFLGPTNIDGKPGIGAMVNDYYDSSLGYGGNRMAVITAPEVFFPPVTFGTDGSVTSQPPSLKVAFNLLTAKRYDENGGLVDDNSFVAQYATQTNYRAFQTFTDFAGASGGAGNNSFVGYFSGGNRGGFVSRGSFHPGYAPSGSYAISRGTPEVWDQGLYAPESQISCSLYRGRVFIWGVDQYGVIGSNYLGSTISGSAEIQNDGTLTRFGKSRLVGTTGIPFVGSFAPPIMPLAGNTASLGLWTQGYNAGQPQSGAVYWLTDTTPTSRDTFGQIVPLSKAPADPPLVFSYTDLPIPSTSNPLGSGSADTALPHFDVEQLLRATTDPTILPNPNLSLGCSPILRAIFDMTGIPFQVVREVATDGQTNGHQGGNALDIIGPSPYLQGDNTALTDLADQEMVDLGAFIKSVPELFASAIRVNPDNDAESIYVLDGKIVTKASFNLTIRSDTQRFIHVSSSESRIRQALKNPGVLAAIGVGPATASIQNGKIVIRQTFQLGQFGSRYVYVNQDQLQNVGKGVKGLSISKQAPKAVHFW